MKLYNIVLSFVLLACLAACGASDTATQQAALGDQAGSALSGFRLPSPDGLRKVSFTEGGLIFDAQFMSLLQAQYPSYFINVARDGNTADFSPTWNAANQSSTSLGAAFFGLRNVHDFDRDKTIRLNWEAGNAEDRAYVGMSNWTNNRWDWYPCDASGMATLNAARWPDYTSREVAGERVTLVAVIVLDDAPGWRLTNGRLGAPLPVAAPVVDSVSPTSGEEGTTGLTLVATTSGGAPDSWAWDFGADITPASSTDESPSVSLGSAGIVACSVTVTNASGSDTFDFNFTITPAMTPPDITMVLPDSGDEGDVMTFMALNAGGSVGSWSWDFGGAGAPNTSTDAEPQITLGAAGMYNGSVTATNSGGSETFPFQFEVLANGMAPVVDSVTPTSGTSGASVTFFPSTVGSVDTWAWDFGGGAVPNISNMDTPVVTLGAPGAYNASLTVENAFGSDTYNFQLVVTGGAAPDITAISPQDGVGGSSVTFSATNVGGAATSWSWDFGGAATPNTSTDENPQVTLGAAGPMTYTITVTASNASGMDTYIFPNFMINPF